MDDETQEDEKKTGFKCQDLKPCSEAAESPIYPGTYVTTFEFSLGKNETVWSIHLLTKWRYQKACLFGDDKFLGEWYLDANKMQAQLTLQRAELENYWRMTGRAADQLNGEGQTNLTLPLVLPDARFLLEEYSKRSRNFKLFYWYKTPEARNAVLSLYTVTN